jgi:pantetheine-phosphate adenylyltransferase
MTQATFAGSFDPPTLGHMDLIIRGSSLFSKLHIVVAVNPDKSGLFDVDERLTMLETMCSDLDNVLIVKWRGLIVDYASKAGCSVLLRGIRGMRDLEYERDIASMNSRLSHGIETVFLFTRPDYLDLSSSAVRELAKSGRMPRGLVSDHVKEALEKRFGPLL